MPVPLSKKEKERRYRVVNKRAHAVHEMLSKSRGDNVGSGVKVIRQSSRTSERKERAPGKLNVFGKRNGLFVGCEVCFAEKLMVLADAVN